MLRSRAEISRLSIEERVQWMVELSREHSKMYCSPGVRLARELYFAQHPTQVIVLKCMDGRIHLPYLTNTPLGIMVPFRNIGGIFNLGWPHLGETLEKEVIRAVRSGRRVLMIISYHYSEGDPRRGCTGFNFDREAATAHVFAIKKQIEEVFGDDHQVVYPLVIGVETDKESLRLHGQNRDILHLADYASGIKEERMRERLEEMYYDMPNIMLNDLFPLVIGNMQHINDISQSERQLNFEHREWAICVGRGFDFLHVPNTAVIIGPYSPNLDEPIQKAARLIEANMKEGRIPDDGFLLLTSAPYYEEEGKSKAETKSTFLNEFAAEVIASEIPHLKMFKMKGVLNWNTRALEIF